MRNVTLLLVIVAYAFPAFGQDEPPPRCSESERYSDLDFWVGEWDVFVGDTRVGRNRIEKVLDGCALIEHWSAAGGGDGKSLFFVDYDGRWTQILTRVCTRSG